MEQETGPVEADLSQHDKTRERVVEVQKNGERKPVLRFLLQSIKTRMAVSQEKRRLNRKLRKEKSKLRKIRRTEKLRQKLGRSIIVQSKKTKL